MITDEITFALLAYRRPRIDAMLDLFRDDELRKSPGGLFLIGFGLEVSIANLARGVAIIEKLEKRTPSPLGTRN